MPMYMHNKSQWKPKGIQMFRRKVARTAWAKKNPAAMERIKTRRAAPSAGR